MSIYYAILEEAVKAEGLKKILGQLLMAARIISKDTAGQIVCHINSGSVTKVIQQVEVK